MFPRFTLTAAAVATLFSCAAQAAEVDDAVIVVTATRQPLRHSEVLSDVTTIDREELSKASPTATLGDILSRENGIESVTSGAPGGSTSVFIRGTNAGHTLLLIDGQRVGSATLGAASFSRIPVSQIERIEILRGPASALYGADAMGGVIQIITRPSDPGTHSDARVGIGSRNTQELNAGIASSIGALSANLRVSALKTDGFNSISNPANGNYNPDKDGYRNRSVNAGLNYAFDQRNEVGASLFHSDGENQYDASFPAPASYDFKTHLKVSSLSAYANNRLTDIWSSNLRVGESIDNSVDQNQPGSQSQFKTTQTQAAWQNNFKLSGGSVLLAVETLNQTVDSTTLYDVTERTIDSLLVGWSGYSNGHRFQANARRDRNSQFGNKTTGNVGYGYQLNNDWRIRASASTGFKAPSFNDLYFPFSGNPNLMPEEAKSWEVGANRESATGNISITTYQSNIKNLIEWRPDDPNNISGNWSPVNVTTTHKGLSLSGMQRYGATSLRAALDLQSNVDDTTGKQLQLRARQRGSFGADQQIGNTLLGAEIQATGKRYSNSANTTRLPGYALVNLKIEHKLSTTWAIFGNILNLFDRNYVARTDYATAGRSVFVGVRYSNQ